MEKIKHIAAFFLCLLLFVNARAQTIVDHGSLDELDPIRFGGDYIVYRGDTIELGPKAFFIDGQIPEQEAAHYPYVFNSVNEAAGKLTDGTEGSPMVLYLAPWVYWIDDPDDPSVREPGKYATPYGLVIECEWLKFCGLTQHPENVVLACNRGQTIGSRGNFTMFRFIGQGTGAENVTFGNYCNVDLEFPLKPELGRKKRAPAIVQAQLIHCNGDKIVARNTRFISRLNLCPFVGGKRVLFDSCHFESTDDALCSTGVYLNSSFDFYGSKPFYITRGTGAVLLNCDITSHTRGNQFFTKAGGQLALVDTRIHSGSVSYLGWQDDPPVTTRNYQYRVTFNGKPVRISEDHPAFTVDMKGKKILYAYRFEYDGKVIYNTYNLLSGEDGWDPMGIRDLVMKAEKETGEQYTMIPTQLTATPPAFTMETGKDTVLVTAAALRSVSYKQPVDGLTWTMAPGDDPFLELQQENDGLRCRMIPVNREDDPHKVLVTVKSPRGLESAVAVEVAPEKLDPPGFITMPRIRYVHGGNLKVEYELDMSYEDRSLVTWYRCSDPQGGHPVEVAVSRLGDPTVEYQLTTGDIGYYIMASVSPKHVRCDPGPPVYAMWKEAVAVREVKSDPHMIHPDLRVFPTGDQPEVIPGFWTLYSFDPRIPGRDRPPDRNRDAWYYGEGMNGAKNHFGLNQAQNARMFFTPVRGSYRDMKVALTLAPFKSAGQGFSVAPLYMDVLIKFDAASLSGYGLRFIRTTKYHNAVDCQFVRYEHGEVTPVGEAVSASCYRTRCHILLEVSGDRIRAHVSSPAIYDLEQYGPEVVHEVNMEARINRSDPGGFGIQFAGGVATLIEDMNAEWGPW